MADPNDDITVLRGDGSISRSTALAAASVADNGPSASTHRILKQRFVLEEQLGSGGMGTVFRAKDLRKAEAHDRQPYVAVKVLNNDFRTHPEAFMALEREASKSQTMSHPNIVSIFDFDKDGDLPFITMELLEGKELAELIRTFPNGLPDEIAWPVIRGVLAGLSHAHDAGVVHADFKPGNVFVTRQNQPKILDFGIARAVQVNQRRGEDTVFDPRKLAALTPAYASWEMLKGDNPEPRDDLYSLGVVLYLILTGHHPYGRRSAVEAEQAKLAPERIKRISRRQWRAIESCLAFNRVDRPASVGVVQHLLTQPSPWRSRTAYVAAAAFAFALLLGYAFSGSDRQEVAQEVRQTTMVDVQVDRLESLLADSRFDDAWHRAVADELTALAALEGGEAAWETMRLQILASYADEIAVADDLALALATYELGRRFGELSESNLLLEHRLRDSIEHHLHNTALSEAWLAELDRRLGLLAEHFPKAAPCRSSTWNRSTCWSV